MNTSMQLCHCQPKCCSCCRLMCAVSTQHLGDHQSVSNSSCSSHSVVCVAAHRTSSLSLQVLSPILLQSDLHSIFGRVAALFSKSLTEAFSRLEPRVCSEAIANNTGVAFLMYSLLHGVCVFHLQNAIHCHCMWLLTVAADDHKIQYVSNLNSTLLRQSTHQ